MRRALRLLSILIPATALAACASPTAPSASPCVAGKVPYASCESRDYVNPLGDYVNPLGDYVNPLGSIAATRGE